MKVAVGMTENAFVGPPRQKKVLAVDTDLSFQLVVPMAMAEGVTGQRARFRQGERVFLWMFTDVVYWVAATVQRDIKHGWEPGGLDPAIFSY